MIDLIYDKKLEQQRALMDQHFAETLDSRGANVKHTTTVENEEIDLPAIPELKILDR